MDFEQLLDQACEVLQRRTRMTDGALRRHLAIDEATYADLKLELLVGRRVVREEAGVVLVWAATATASAQAPEPAPSPGPAPLPMTGDAEAAASPQAERRQLTVLFCDLTGSTALSNQLVAEDLQTVLQTFRGAVQAVVEQHGGVVNAFQGDGVVVAFGYPQAREDAARQAARAGLALHAALAPLQVQGHALRSRVGIATGLVIVDDVNRRSAAREEALIGPTIALAARMQSLAAPGQVVLMESTHQMLGQRFDCEDLGPVAVPAQTQPLRAWRLVGERQAEAALQASAVAPRPPLLGRDVEWPVLRQSWQQALAGEGRVVTLLGDAGMGKSRLAEALCESLADSPHRLLRAFCQSHFEYTSLQPVVQQIVNAAGMTDADDDRARLSRLEALFGANQEPARLQSDLPYLAALLAIPTAGRYPALVDSPDKQRERTLEVLLAMVRHIAAMQPVLIVYEDLHWADPTTAELLLRLAQSLHDQRVLLLVTARSGYEPPWAELPHALSIDLTPLRRHHRAAIVAFHSAAHPLPAAVVAQIVERGEGNPLWVEELTKAALESAESATTTQPAAVPRSLQDSLQARLDRQGAAKEVMQVGAAIGREFLHTLLEAVLGWPDERLRGCLGQLMASGLLNLRGLPPQAVYAFKHALIQDAAYDTMLRTRRRELHRRIADLLEADGAAVREPEQLARHLSEAGLPMRAAPYRLQAGLKAQRAGAKVEAERHFDAGLRLLDGLPEDDERRALELPLRLHLGETLAATRGYAAPEVAAQQERARELCGQLGNQRDLFWVLDGLCVYRTVLSQQAQARELADAMNVLADELGRPEYQVEAAVMEAWTYGSSGRLQRAHDAMARAVRLFHRADPAFIYPTPQSPLVSALSWQSALALVLGEEPASAALIAALRQATAAVNTPFDSAFAHTWFAMTHNLRGEFDAAVQEADRALALAQRHGFPVWLAAAGMQKGVALGGLGNHAACAAIIEPTLQAYRASGAELNTGFFTVSLAQAWAALGRLDDARRLIEAALALSQRTEEKWMDAELHRQRAELLAADAEGLPAALDALETALAIAREQGARLFELRAAHAMARLAAESGEGQPRAQAELAAALHAGAGLAALPEFQAAQTLLASHRA